MKNVVVYREPKLKPLPPSLQLDVKGATLPAKIETARRAIALCTDLPELLHYKQHAEGIAAAVKVIREVAPEIVKNANAMVRQSCFRIGEMLIQYSGVRTTICVKGVKGIQGAEKSPRRKVSDSLGISKSDAASYVRLGATPKDIQQKVIDNDAYPTSLRELSERVPARRIVKRTHSEIYSVVMSGQKLSRAYCGAKEACDSVSARELRQLPDDEKKLIRKKIAEIIEFLDVIDEACK